MKWCFVFQTPTLYPGVGSGKRPLEQLSAPDHSGKPRDNQLCARNNGYSGAPRGFSTNLRAKRLSAMVWRDFSALFRSGKETCRPTEERRRRLRWVWRGERLLNESRRPEADRRGTAKPCGGILSPVPWGCRGIEGQASHCVAGAPRKKAGEMPAFFRGA